jgi:hypothetical protein
MVSHAQDLLRFQCFRQLLNTIKCEVLGVFLLKKTASTSELTVFEPKRGSRHKFDVKNEFRVMCEQAAFEVHVPCLAEAKQDIERTVIFDLLTGHP